MDITGKTTRKTEKKDRLETRLSYSTKNTGEERPGRRPRAGEATQEGVALAETSRGNARTHATDTAEAGGRHGKDDAKGGGGRKEHGGGGLGAIG